MPGADTAQHTFIFRGRPATAAGTSEASLTIASTVPLACATVDPDNPPAGYTVISGNNRSNVLIGTNGNNIIFGRGGNDVIDGRGTAPPTSRHGTSGGQAIRRTTGCAGLTCSQPNRPNALATGAGA